MAPKACKLTIVVVPLATEKKRFHVGLPLWRTQFMSRHASVNPLNRIYVLSTRKSFSKTSVLKHLFHGHWQRTSKRTFRGNFRNLFEI